jgi:hypothetical protein
MVLGSIATELGSSAQGLGLITHLRSSAHPCDQVHLGIHSVAGTFLTTYT